MRMHIVTHHDHGDREYEFGSTSEAIDLIRAIDLSEDCDDYTVSVNLDLYDPLAHVWYPHSVWDHRPVADDLVQILGCMRP